MHCRDDRKTYGHSRLENFPIVEDKVFIKCGNTDLCRRRSPSRRKADGKGCGIRLRSDAAPNYAAYDSGHPCYAFFKFLLRHPPKRIFSMAENTDHAGKRTGLVRKSICCSQFVNCSLKHEFLFRERPAAKTFFIYFNVFFIGSGNGVFLHLIRILFQIFTENHFIIIAGITDVQMEYLFGKVLQRIVFAQINTIFVFSSFCHNGITTRKGNLTNRFG